MALAPAPSMADMQSILNAASGPAPASDNNTMMPGVSYGASSAANNVAYMEKFPALMQAYSSGLGDGSDASAQAALAVIKKYDPNAKISTSLSGDNNTQSYIIDYDHSKMPQIPKGAFPLAPTQNGIVLAHDHMYNPSLVVNDPNFGALTPSYNVKPDPGNPILGFLDKVLPYAVMGTLGYGAGLAGTSLLGATGLPTAISSGLGKTLGNFGLQEIMSGGNAKLNPLSVAGNLVGAIPGVGDVMNGINSAISPIMPYLNIAKLIAGAKNGNPMDIAQLAKMGYNMAGGH